jgi:hypothetical protein
MISKNQPIFPLFLGVTRKGKEKGENHGLSGLCSDSANSLQSVGRFHLFSFNLVAFAEPQQTSSFCGNLWAGVSMFNYGFRHLVV